MVRVIASFLLLSALSGCASQQERLVELAHAHNESTQVIDTGLYPIQVMRPKGIADAKRLTIFIEGDGHAWATSTQPSTDPSPLNLSFAALAASTTTGIYVARPCQFVMNASCDRSMWTDARFGKSAVVSMQRAIDALKRSYKADSLELIGYSGGAAIAMLVAGEREDVAQVQTIAGNVDPVGWVTLNKLSPLKGSLDPLEHAERLSRIPQRHFVGAGDKVIPKALADGFVRKVSARCAEVVEVSGDHASILSSVTRERLSREIMCKSF
ncbi:alpha/beta hydrolase [Pseudomonas putida]|uniref:Alpha/beta hydrolase n=1 Tax=Pseudomonas putida TaxID=303 RepID=A0A8I1EBZ8_PSEPU|nr:alpha/beta hydrolase [Pseudomonas putida]MBI6882493.1 alpha/beta hydrolase [Pseudomonas putida]